jgi:hypothetical protein
MAERGNHRLLRLRRRQWSRTKSTRLVAAASGEQPLATQESTAADDPRLPGATPYCLGYGSAAALEAGIQLVRDSCTPSDGAP